MASSQLRKAKFGYLAVRLEPALPVQNITSDPRKKTNRHTPIALKNVHDVVGNTPNVRIHLTERCPVAVRGVVHPDNDRLLGAHDDDPLCALPLLLATPLQERRPAVLVVHLRTREGVLLTRYEEAGRRHRRQLGLACQKGGQLLRLVGQDFEALRGGPLLAGVPVDRRVLCIVGLDFALAARSRVDGNVGAYHEAGRDQLVVDVFLPRHGRGWWCTTGKFWWGGR